MLCSSTNSTVANFTDNNPTPRPCMVHTVYGFLSDNHFVPHDPGYFNSESFLNNNILLLSVYFLEMGQPWEIIDL